MRGKSDAHEHNSIVFLTEEGFSVPFSLYLYELRFRAGERIRRTSSRCSDEEVSSLLELLLAAGATMLYTLVGQSRAMHPSDALPTHQHCLSIVVFVKVTSKDCNAQMSFVDYLPT